MTAGLDKNLQFITSFLSLKTGIKWFFEIIITTQRYSDCKTINPFVMKKALRFKNLILVFTLLASQHLFAQDETQLPIWTAGAGTTDWFTASNWNGGVPDETMRPYIPALSSGIYPVLNSKASILSLTIKSGASLIVNDTLELRGNINNTGTFNVLNGTLKFTNHVFLTLQANLFYQNTIKNLIVDENCRITLNATTSDSITGMLTLLNKSTLITNDNLVIRSTANGTGSIGSLPVDIDGLPTVTISGNISIERFIPARKAWRLLSVPVQSSGAPTIHAAWQEGSSYPSSFSMNAVSSLINPKPNYGAHIMGGTILNGFDPSATNIPSLKYYDNATNTFKGLASTFIPITAYPAYVMYIRGDRSIDVSGGTPAEITSTTLEIMGKPIMGNQTFNVSNNNFTLLGNPYASAIDFGTIDKTGVSNTFYVWDPKAGGLYGLGAYATVSWNAGTQQYDVTSATSQISQYIPSGEAVFVKADVNTEVYPRSVTIKESDKTTNGSDHLFGRIPTPGKAIRANLYAYNSDGSTSLLDGALTTYHDRNTNDIDDNDATKLFGSSESINLTRQGTGLSIERRKTITTVDTSFIALSRMRRQTYRLAIVAENMGGTALTAVIKDRYSSTINNRVLDLNGTTNIDFTVDANPGSYASNRFSIVFVKRTTNPVNETLVRRNGTDVEESIVKPAVKSASSILIYPNPISTNDINIKLNNMEAGSYMLKLYNIGGQLIATQSLTYNNNGANIQMKVDAGFTPGKYELKIEGQGKSISASVLKQ